MRVLHVDYGVLEFSEFLGIATEISRLINSCDNFTHFETEHFTQNDKHGISVKMELMENNRPQANSQPAEPAKSIITFSAFKNATFEDGLRMLMRSIFAFYLSKPFHNEVLPSDPTLF